MQINNNYSSPSFGVKVSSGLPDVLTEKLPTRYQYKNAIKDIQNQTEKLSKWGSDFLEISSQKDANTEKDVLILQYKNKNEIKTTALKASEKGKSKSQILSSFLSLTKNDILRAEKDLWHCKKDLLSHRTSVRRDNTQQVPIFKRTKFE